MQRCWRGHLNYQDRCIKLNLHSLEYRRLVQDLVLCFKLHRNLVNVNSKNLLGEIRGRYTRTGGWKMIGKFNVRDVAKNFFCNRIVNPWNHLDKNHSKSVNSMSVSSFKKHLCVPILEMFLKCFKF